MQTPTESAEARYRKTLSEGRFEIQKCQDCQRHVFPPRVVCNHCGGTNLEWQKASGAGTVYSATVVARREEKGGPYNVALVALDEGVHMMSHVTGFGANDVPIGLPVVALIEPETERLVFERAKGAS